MHFMVDMARDLSRVAEEERTEAVRELSAAWAEALWKLPSLLAALEAEPDRPTGPVS